MEGEMIDLQELQDIEARPSPGQNIVYHSTKEEVDHHNNGHFPFRNCCPFRVQGKCGTGAHMRRPKTEEEPEKETLVIPIDYAGQKSNFLARLKDAEEERITSLPILTGIDRRTKRVFAHMVPKEGRDAQAIKIQHERSNSVGTTDQEASIKAFIDAVKTERAEQFEKMMQEETPVGEHQCNGEVESAIRSILFQSMGARSGQTIQSRHGW